MTNAVPPAIPGEVMEESQPRKKHRAWLWIPIWIALFLALPGFLVGLLQQQKAKQYAASLPTISQSQTAVAPQWLPLRAEYRVQQASLSPTSGNAILLTTDSIETALQQMEDRFRQNGFEVSRNLMNHDDSISTAILNASHTTRGHFALITLSRSAHGTRIELSFSEKIAEQK